MRKLLIVILLLLSTSAFASEVLVDFSQESLSILNERLRQIEDKMEARVVTTVPTGTDFTGRQVLYISGTTQRLYTYDGTQWNYVGYVDTDGTVSLDGEINIGSHFKADDTNGMWLGDATFGSAPFRVNLAGDLVATSATISGAITAESGSIGGWSIETGYLAKDTGTDATSAGLAPSDYPFYAGAIYNNRATAPFRVTPAGAVTATSGSIGGWTLASDRLSYGTDSDYIGLIPGTGIQMGDSTFGDAEFSVTNAGVLKATSGTIGGWTLGANSISSTNLQIDSENERIQTTDFVSGVLGKGWRIDNSGAEFQNIIARGKISTVVFEKTSVSVLGGNFLIAQGDVLVQDMSAND